MEPNGLDEKQVRTQYRHLSGNAELSNRQGLRILDSKLDAASTSWKSQTRGCVSECGLSRSLNMPEGLNPF